MKEKYALYIAANPGVTQAQVATHFGISRQRVSQICMANGIKLPRAVPVYDRDAGKAVQKPSIISANRTAPSKDKCLRGAASEALVTADLLDMGFHVYRAFGSSAPFDLVVLVAGRMLRVEVKTAITSNEGKIFKPSLRDKSLGKDFDILACVKPGMDIAYEPTVENWHKT